MTMPADSSVHATLAPEISLTRYDGQEVPLAGLWKSQPLLIQFSRHLGCAFCRDHAKQLLKDYETLKSHGAEVALVTMGDVKAAQEFRDTLKLTYPVYADPDRKAYEAFEVARGSVWQVAGPQVWGQGFGALLRSGLGVPRGDLMQLQATFLINPEGMIIFEFRPENSADHPALADVLRAIERTKSAAN